MHFTFNFHSMHFGVMFFNNEPLGFIVCGKSLSTSSKISEVISAISHKYSDLEPVGFSNSYS